MSKERNIYYINVKKKKRNTAGAKAPADINELCRRRGYKSFFMPQFPTELGKKRLRLWKLTNGMSTWLRLFSKVKKDDVILYQHPIYAHKLASKMIPWIRKHKKCKFVVLIHDLESLRKGIDGVIKNDAEGSYIADNVLLKQFDAVICHNDSMKEYLISQGFDEDKITTLEIFDYLSDAQVEPKLEMDEKPSIAIAGNLAAGKCGYIYKIKDEENNKDLVLNLYGVNYEEKTKSEDIRYKGCFKPEELAEYLEGDFGLVWDGQAADKFMGNTGEYLRYINPHKTSLYLSSKMPVVIGREVGIADFVVKNNLGIAVNSLYEVEDRIKSMTQEEYNEICQNIEEVSTRLRSGYYFYKAFDKVLSFI